MEKETGHCRRILTGTLRRLGTAVDSISQPVLENTAWNSLVGKQVSLEEGAVCPKGLFLPLRALQYLLAEGQSSP